MKYANAEHTFIEDGTRHIPVAPGNADYDAIVAAGASIEPYSPPPPALSDYTAAIEDKVNAVAKAKGYASGVRLVSYLASTNPQWAAEAQTFIAWRDTVWAYAYTALEQVQSGARPVPAIGDLVAELPEITWPE